MPYIKLTAVLFISLFICNLSSASTVEEDVQKIQNAYSKIEDIKGSFIQKSYIKDLKKTETYKGSLLIKRPSKMRWEYKGEKPQEVIINNDRIIIYKKTDKQAYKGNFDRQTYGQAPVALLNGFGNINEEFNITKKNDRLILKPKKPMSNIVSIEIETSAENFPIKYFVINDTYSNKVEIRLENIEINTGVKDSIFNFSLPKGTNIYEYNSQGS